MDILQWDKLKQSWKIAVPGTDKLDPGYINPTFSEDVKVVGAANGLILNSATKEWRVTVNDSGVLVITEILSL